MGSRPPSIMTTMIQLSQARRLPPRTNPLVTQTLLTQQHHSSPMAEFTDEVLDQIGHDPLEPEIGQLRHYFRSTPIEEWLNKKSKNKLSQLILTILQHSVAKILPSRDGKTLSSELGTLLGGMISGSPAEAEPFLPYAHIITEDHASDVDTWKAVFDLIAEAKETTPEPTLTGSVRAYTSATHQGSNQTRKSVEDVLRQELRDCSFRNVEGFFEKYFDEGPWTEQSKSIYEAVKNDIKSEFPSNPTEDTVWRWLLKFQKSYLLNLPDTRGEYHRTTKTRQVIGGDAPR